MNQDEQEDTRQEERDVTKQMRLFESPGSYEVHVWTSRALECLGVLRRSDDFEVGLLKINRDHLESSHLEDISSVR